MSETDSRLSFTQLMKWLFWLYWIGVIIFSLNFLLQVAILFLRAYIRPAIVDGKYRIVEMEGEHAPCSFLNNIFINPSRYDWNTYSQILLHEKVHVSEKHSLDILFAEIMLIFQWFNPFAWMYRKEMENNLEFLTDKTVLEKGEMEMSSYQMSLLKVSATHLPLSLTSNYNQSLLKKRIAMMNAKKSNLNTSWKYFFLLPMFAFFACLLNQPMAQDKNSNKNTATKPTNAQNPKKATNATNAKPATKATNAQNPKPVEVKKNKNVKSNENKNHDGDIATEGYWNATIKGEKIQFQLCGTPECDKNSFSGTSFSLSDFPSLPRTADADFKLTRDAGTMHFKGRFEGNDGKGSYKFVSDKAYIDYMNQQHLGKLEDEDFMTFFMVNIQKSQVEMYKSRRLYQTG